MQPPLPTPLGADICVLCMCKLNRIITHTYANYPFRPLVEPGGGLTMTPAHARRQNPLGHTQRLRRYEREFRRIKGKFVLKKRKEGRWSEGEMCVTETEGWMQTGKQENRKIKKFWKMQYTCNEITNPWMGRDISKTNNKKQRQK